MGRKVTDGERKARAARWQTLKTLIQEYERKIGHVLTWRQTLMLRRELIAGTIQPPEGS